MLTTAQALTTPCTLSANQPSGTLSRDLSGPISALGAGHVLPVSQSEACLGSWCVFPRFIYERAVLFVVRLLVRPVWTVHCCHFHVFPRTTSPALAITLVLRFLLSFSFFARSHVYYHRCGMPGCTDVSVIFQPCCRLCDNFHTTSWSTWFLFSIQHHHTISSSPNRDHCFNRQLTARFNRPQALEQRPIKSCRILIVLPCSVT